MLQKRSSQLLGEPEESGEANDATYLYIDVRDSIKTVPSIHSVSTSRMPGLG